MKFRFTSKIKVTKRKYHNDPVKRIDDETRRRSMMIFVSSCASFKASMTHATTISKRFQKPDDNFFFRQKKIKIHFLTPRKQVLDTHLYGAHHQRNIFFLVVKDSSCAEETFSFYFRET
jgi:hypothetical protein